VKGSVEYNATLLNIMVQQIEQQTLVDLLQSGLGWTPLGFDIP